MLTTTVKKTTKVSELKSIARRKSLTDAARFSQVQFTPARFGFVIPSRVDRGTSPIGGELPVDPRVISRTEARQLKVPHQTRCPTVRLPEAAHVAGRAGENVALGVANVRDALRKRRARQIANAVAGVLPERPLTPG